MKTDRHQIFVGLNDSRTKEQRFATEQLERIVGNVCKGYRVGFSLSEMHGGYLQDDGTFVAENSLCLTLIGSDDALAEEIAKDICAFFHQESVLVTHDTIDCRFVRESLG